MKKTICLLFLFWIACGPLQSSELIDFLKRQPNVTTVETIPSHPFFSETVEIRVNQQVDHSDARKGFFQQRVFIALLEKSAPVVLVTEGYAAHYGKSPRYINELSQLLNASQVVVEHRYFGESVPDPLNWEYLTVENAAADHHAVVSLLKPFFSGDWINTGISKGGQTALLHRVYYPDDVALTVSYVAPMNFAVEDGRHEPYISKVSGTKEGRKKVQTFQKEVLKRRNALMPLFEKYVEDKKITFRTSLSEIYDLTVLEYSFSFWQWGNNPDLIPPISAPDSTVFNHWFKVITPDYFSTEEFKNTGAFFVQAARQLGYYGYDTKPFKKWISIKNSRGYLYAHFLPEGYKPSFDREPAIRSQRFLNAASVPMVFIYGQDDPWTASGVTVPAKGTILKIVQSGGSHRTRIATLDEENKRLVMKKIRETVSVKETVDVM